MSQLYFAINKVSTDAEDSQVLYAYAPQPMVFVLLTMNDWQVFYLFWSWILPCELS